MAGVGKKPSHNTALIFIDQKKKPFFYFFPHGRCHIVPVGQTRCGSHSECALPSTECGFVDAYLQPSFGNVLCSACTARPMCLASSSSGGQCVCTLRPTTYQTCSQPGMRVIPDATQLCLVSLTSSAFSSSSSSYAAGFPSLAAAPCALLNQADTYCLSVYDGDVDTLLAVGLSLLSSSSSARRRLLHQDISAEPYPINHTAEWALAHEPCRSLMTWAHGAGGGSHPMTSSILDALAAAECQRWRDIGERSAVAFNLTRVPPVAFTSWTGLLETALADTVAMRQLAAAWPRLPLFLASYHPMAQPLTLLTLRLWRLLPETDPNSSLSTPFLFTNSSSSSWISGFGYNNITTLPAGALHLPDLVLLLNPVAPKAILPSQTQLRGGAPPRRHLLQQDASSWKATLADVRQYSTQIVGGMTGTLSPDLASQWSTGPFVWPPDFSSTESGRGQCLAASIAFNLTIYIAGSTIAYYTGNGPPRPPVARTFADCVPKLPYKAFLSGSNSSSSQATQQFQLLDTAVSGFIDRGYLLGYISAKQPGNRPSQLSQDITTVLSCDFDSVQHCTRFTRDLGWGALILTLGLGCASYIARSIGVPGADPLLFLSFLPLLSVFVFGVSPFCTPMISTCLFDELVNLLTYLFPVTLTWPDMLQYYPGCASGATPPNDPSLAWRANSAACFRSCSDWPFGFRDPRDNVAWVSLRLGLPELPTSPDALGAWLGQWIPAAVYGPVLSVVPDWMFLWDRYDTQRPYLTWADMRDAQDVCFGLTAFNLLLLVLAIIGAAILAAALVMLPALLAQFAVGMFVSVLVFTHS